MKRQSKGTVFDISIRGDELENNRIQLEHNLQNTELSFRLSSTSDDEHEHELKSQRRSRKHQPRNNHNNNSSVEYPRHISEPSLADDYPPFWANRSRERMDDEDQHQMRAWSYRSGDDEDGISPYGGETVSTAAHHASAITINTGLGGGRAARRDPSLSGAEYDPDRPLHAMIAGVNSKHSMFDMDPSKHHATTANMTHDPLVVDSTAELDRILASGHAPLPPPANSRSFQPTPPTSSVSSDSEGGHTHTGSARPKLTDHLRHVSFSPKRPRTAQNVHASPLVRAARTLEEDNNNDNNNASMNMPTPRPARRANYAASPAQPEVRLQPATPSTGGSKFTRMARGINRELEATQAQEQLNAKHAPHAQTQAAPRAQAGGARPASAPPERNPFYDFGTRSQRRTPARDPTMTSGRIHLPDVTGLTSAVESPAKHGAHYYPYKGDDRPRDSEARLLQTLSSVQGQLRDLEEENSISRRRVRELEMELEECKRHVARERTRLFEREELELDARLGYRGAGAGNTSKGKGKAMEGHLELDDERLHARYKEAVDEKKALEALINSLRSHLTRLTAELASHQELLNELRRLRDADARALQDKGAEIGRLKEEVQRLAGEVEVLRGVVEEGLKERRASREVEEIGIGESLGTRADMAMSRDLEEEEEEMELEEIEEVTEEEELSEQEEDEEDEGNETEEPEPFDPVSLQQSSPVNRADRTMRTDHATLGSSNLGASVNTNGNNDRHGSPRFVDEEELDIIAQEMEERRSNRSNGSIGSLQRRTVRSVSPPGSRDQNGRYERQRAMVEDEVEDEQRQQQEQQQRPPTSRPAGPTPTHAKKQYARPHPPQERNASVNNYNYNGEAVVEPETPFPQIRGEHLERLFFSAPEHNAKTCTVCYRRRHRANSVGGTGASPSWSHPRRAGQAQAHAREREEEDEGYEGSEGAEGERPHAAVGGASKGKQREYVAFSEDIRHWQKAGQAHGVPPQTVVARVIRELEDDFTHYKSIYVELADQYKVMDAASDVKRRNLLAKHLREVVDILEQKGDQIASLYDLLEFKDKPVLESVVPGNPTTSWGKSARRTTTTN
ncbi:hypothetical protein CVT25_003117 [Psilocybe cyanescens]|uniref:Cep57 centrosome microtubule-binding domain-containing protein n=1 Tax=Psilocybe cyanescens TaxID=93625 RepID=A0A409XQJ8_PSICY|nr:hypothetical protein CVT25_003117 [Psilocybe cyanescens]